MPFLNEEGFVKEFLPTLIGSKASLRALFVTYNSVSGFATGEVPTGKVGLRVFVHAGDVYSNPIMESFSAMVIGCGIAGQWEGVSVAARVCDQIAVTVQKSAEAKIKEARILEGEQAIVFVYAGLSAYDSALDYARRLHAARPTLKVLLVTCTCDIRVKQAALEPLLENGELAAVIQTWACGADQLMGNLVEAVISTWPEIVPANN